MPPGDDGRSVSVPSGRSREHPTHRLQARSDRRTVQQFRLRLGEEELFRSAAERTVVGTHPSVDVVVEDPTVSRFHCEIVSDDDGALIRDLDSSNGTVVNGVSVLAARLEDGCTIRLGRTLLRFELSRDTVDLELSKRSRFGSMVGASQAMRRTFALLERASQTDATLLIRGETGTGKELAARAVHEHSKRRRGPFVVVDCGAVPANLLESQLFGHVRGAFTGATEDREGAYSSSSGGTLFLDEIGELGLDLQPKLLRVLETKVVQPVGRDRATPVDVRVIAATNRNLSALVNEQRFRADLYYRLAVLEVRLPALRERKEDIPLLVERLLAVSSAARNNPLGDEALDETFLADLFAHSWPGNVRELNNYLERCLLLGIQEPFGEDGGLEPEFDANRPLKLERARWVERFERRYLEALMARSRGRVTEAARRAGVNRSHLYRLLSKHGLR